MFNFLKRKKKYTLTLSTEQEHSLLNAMTYIKEQMAFINTQIAHVKFSIEALNREFKIYRRKY